MSVTPVGGNPSKDCGCCGDLPPEANECFCVGQPFEYRIELSGSVISHGVYHNFPSTRGCGTPCNTFGFGNKIAPPNAPDINGHYFAPCNNTITTYRIYQQTIGSLLCRDCFVSYPIDYHIELAISRVPLAPPGYPGGGLYPGISVALRSFGAAIGDFFNQCGGFNSCLRQTSVTAYFPWGIPADPVNNCPTSLGLAEYVTRVPMQTASGGLDDGLPLGGAFDVSEIDIDAELLLL